MDFSIVDMCSPLCGSRGNSHTVISAPYSFMGRGVSTMHNAHRYIGALSPQSILPGQHSCSLCSFVDMQDHLLPVTPLDHILISPKRNTSPFIVWNPLRVSASDLKRPGRLPFLSTFCCALISSVAREFSIARAVLERPRPNTNAHERRMTICGTLTMKTSSENGGYQNCTHIRRVLEAR